MSNRNEIVEGRPIRCYSDIARQEYIILYMDEKNTNQLTYDWASIYLTHHGLTK